MGILAAVLGGLALLGGGMFIGSQVDDYVDKPRYSPPENGTEQNLIDKPMIKYPVMIGGVILAVGLARKLLKKTKI